MRQRRQYRAGRKMMASTSVSTTTVHLGALIAPLSALGAVGAAALALVGQVGGAILLAMLVALLGGVALAGAELSVAARGVVKAAQLAGVLLFVVLLVSLALRAADAPVGMELEQGAWRASVVDYKINDLGLLEADVTVTNTSESTLSGALGIEVSTTNGSDTLLGTVENLGAGRSRQVSFLGSGGGSNPQAGGLEVIAQY